MHIHRRQIRWLEPSTEGRNCPATWACKVNTSPSPPNNRWSSKSLTFRSNSPVTEINTDGMSCMPVSKSVIPIMVGCSVRAPATEWTQSQRPPKARAQRKPNIRRTFWCNTRDTLYTHPNTQQLELWNGTRSYMLGQFKNLFTECFLMKWPR